MTDFTLKYLGSNASRNELEFYDAAQAMIGFQRSLALTMNLAVNGEIITQAPSLKNATTMILPPRPGSWEVVATAIFGGVGASLIAGKDTVLGHFTRSLYDYALNSILGITVDFDRTIRSQFAELCEEKKITEAKADSLIEKTENAVIAMHRPIVASQSAQRARILFDGSSGALVGPTFTSATFIYASKTIELNRPEMLDGYVSSYNANTFKGRIFIIAEQRPVPFELSNDVRDRRSVGYVTNSLALNAANRSNPAALLTISAFRRESSTHRLKSVWVVAIAPRSSALP